MASERKPTLEEAIRELRVAFEYYSNRGTKSDYEAVTLAIDAIQEAADNDQVERAATAAPLIIEAVEGATKQAAREARKRCASMLRGQACVGSKQTRQRLLVLADALERGPFDEKVERGPEVELENCANLADITAARCHKEGLLLAASEGCWRVRDAIRALARGKEGRDGEA